MTWNLRSKVCIVGSGFCGYAAYKKLKKNNLDLILVEGGDVISPKSEKQQPSYKVKTNNYLKTNIEKRLKNMLDVSFRDRKFTLGGSSTCWSGYIKPFEKSTYDNYFKGIENQRWGTLRLDKYNKEILSLLNSPTFDFSPESISKKTNSELPNLPEGFEFTTYAWAESPLRLKSFWIKRLKNKTKDQKDVISGYRLTDFKINKDKLIGLIFKNKEGKTLFIESEYFMFCMGGIENARFTKKLFESIGKYPLNKGNLCNFQEHPHLFYLGGFNRGENTLPKIITHGIKVSPSLHNSFNKKGKIIINFKAWAGIGTPKVSFRIKENKIKLKNGIKNILKGLLKRNIIPNSDYFIVMRCEQTPNKQSYLKFESNKTSLNWNIIEEDFSHYSDYLRKLTSYLILNKYAKDFSLRNNAIKGEAIPNSVNGGAHHMGTVPYDINNNLINEKFVLTDFKNTYVVGSSAFPTSGFENPTHAAMCTALIAAEDILQRI